MRTAFAIPLWQQTLIQTAVCMVGAAIACWLAVIYFRRVRVERPPIGTFNLRDITILLTIILLLPFLYAVLPNWAMTCFLALTFCGSLFFGYSQVLPPRLLWALIGLLLGANIYESHFMMGTVLGWQVWWIELDILVIAGVAAVSNLYIQGGMRLSHVVYFALALAVYDAFAELVINVTAVLVSKFLGQPLDPMFGMRFQTNNYAVGIGDLLVYAVFTVACYKAFGRAAAWTAGAVAVVFGAAAPTLFTFLVALIDFRGDVLVPSQVFFAPAALVAYLLMRRKYGRERTMAEFMASSDNVMPVSPPAQPTPAPEPVGV
jgi:hypothetical protein